MTRIIENINAHIADEQSKFVYQNRVMYSLTKDYSYILNIVKNSKEFQWLIERINQIEIFYCSKSNLPFTKLQTSPFQI